MFLAPTNVYPTGLEMGGENVKVVKYDESIYVVGGHNLVKDAIKAARNIRNEKNVPPSKKAKIFVITIFYSIILIK